MEDTSMKKVFITILIACCMFGMGFCRRSSRAVDAAHNSRNSLNWQGVYAGVIPAADGPGISVQITLNDDETYTIRYQYIDRAGSGFTDSGAFTWDDEGSVITLDTRDFPPYYQVGENRLIQLDMSGEPIRGGLADNYVLKKTL
jgi:uncharacterized lipoprotein NlpE involved in copper resistance